MIINCSPINLTFIFNFTGYTYDGSFKTLPKIGPDGQKVTKRSNTRGRSYDTTVFDARDIQNNLSVLHNGFKLIPFDSPIDVSKKDSDQIISVYYKYVENLVRAQLEAEGVKNILRVLVFDHTIRSRIQREKKEKETNGENIGGYAAGVHNDNTSRSARARIKFLTKTKKEGGSVTLPTPPLTEKEADDIVSGHFGIFNVWRHYREDYPVLDFPLAILDAQTARENDFPVNKYIYPHRVGEVVGCYKKDYHKWYYFSEMKANEALFFKVFDSQSEVYENVNVPLHTAHTAFQIPGSNDATPPRESIECRCLVHFGSESKL